MIFKSPIFAQASGSLAGTVFSHNQGGMYVRARATPTNPNSEAQQAVRDALREAVFRWSNVLTDAQRTNWNTYAFNTPTFNRLGEATHKTGQQMFVRGCVPRLQAGLAIPANAPTSFDLGSFTAIDGLIADSAADTIEFNINNTDQWAIAAGNAMLIYQGRPQNSTRIYGKGPYQLAHMIQGAVVPPGNAVSFASLFPFVAGQRIFIKVNVSMADGRYTVPSLHSAIAADV